MNLGPLDQIDRFLVVVLVHEKRDAGEQIHGAALVIALCPEPFEGERRYRFGDGIGAFHGRLIRAIAFRHVAEIHIHGIELVPTGVSQAGAGQNGDAYRSLFVIF